MTRGWALAACAAVGAAHAAPPPPPAAILCVTAGTVRVSGNAQKARAAGRWEWLRPGARLDVAADGRAVLAFADGRRQELTPGTRARLGREGAVAERGAVRALPPLPALAELLALADGGPPDARAAAVRVRAPRITGLWPGADAITLAAATTLTFDPVPAAPRYSVEVADEAGAPVFERVTETPRLDVPADVLRPGAHYTWKVRTVDRLGPAAEGRASFRTLPAASVAARERLRAQTANDPVAPALLAAVDQRLGLAETVSVQRR